MGTENKKSKGFYLKWPWNLLVYILLVVALRIFAIPLILLIMAWNKKQQPDGPEEGYCLQRTRRRLARLVWAALFLIIGAAGAVTFITQIQADRSGWEVMDYATLAVAAVMGLGGTIAGLYEGYTDIRDALFPAKSRLANSIRSQLPYPDEAPDVRELFAMVDQDIRENGQWFDRVAVGKEWLFGDDVTAISRIRAVFGRDEIIRSHSGGRTQRTRVVELHVLDDRHQAQVTALRNPNELEPLLICLKLRVPAALFLPYDQYLDYRGKSEEEWNRLEWEFRHRKDQLEAEASQNSPAASPQPQNASNQAYAGSQTASTWQRTPQSTPQRQSQIKLSLTYRSGATRSYTTFTRRDVELAGEGLSNGKYSMVMLSMGAQYIYIQTGTSEDARLTVQASRPDPDELRLFEIKCRDREAQEWLLDLADGRFAPDFSQWKDITKKIQNEIRKSEKAKSK